MTEDSLIRILLVRAAEESTPRFFTSGQISEADTRAGEVTQGIAWIGRRASYLAALLPEGVRRAADIARLPAKRLFLLGIPVFIMGVLSNFLGPASTFHILYNPMTALVLWNLAVFVAFIAPALSSFRQASPVQKALPFSHRVMASLWMRLNRFSGGLDGARESGLPVSDVLKRFWVYYTDSCGALATSRLRLLFHICALGLIAGAIAGMYVRGVFLEYAVVWRSTFIHDPETIRFLLNLSMGLPSYVLSGGPVTPAQVTELTGPAGSPAAAWIHLLTLTALLFAALPRTVLLIIESVRLRRGVLSVRADVDQPYFQEITRRAWEARIEALRGQLDAVLSRESAKFSGTVAAYVREQLYDRSIVPVLTAFRDEGGRIADLERTITAFCKDFEKPLGQYIASLQEDLKSSLASQIEALMGKQEAGPEFSVDHGSVHSSAEEASRLRGEDLTDTFAGMIHVTITTVITGTLATVSGGLGKSLGVAIVSVLLHTTGPVGLLIGALIGLMVAGGVSWATKDMINEAVKDYPLPAIMMRTLFSDEKLKEKIEEGRTQIYVQVEQETLRQMRITSEKLQASLLANLMDAFKAARPA